MDIQLDQRGASMAPAARPGNAPSGTNTAQPAALVSVADLLFILRRNAVPIAVCAFAGAVVAYVYAATLQKSYTAYGAIAVQGEQMAIPQLQGVLRTDAEPDPMPFVRTEEQALGAHPLLVRVTNELHLDRDPEFNAALRPPTFFGSVVGQIKSWLPHPAAAPADNGNDAVVNAVAHALAITQDNRSLVIGVSFTAHDPRLAAAVVNRLIGDYIYERVTRRSAADLGAHAEINHRIDQVRGEIDGLEHQMQDLRTRSGMITLRAGSVSQQELEDLTNEASKAEVQRSEIAANLARAQAAAATGSADELASVIGSETISRLREQESEASGRAADLAARFGPEYPALRSAEADVGAVRAQLRGEAHRIVASLQLQLNVAQQHEADVKAQLEAARQAGAQAQDTQAQLEQFQQDVATRRALYASLLQSAQQTVAQPRADALPDVRVLSRADVPGLPSAPNMKLAAGLGGVAGGMLAGLVGFVRSASRSRFRNEADIAETTGAVILASLRGHGNRGRWEKLAQTAQAAPSGDDAVALRAAQGRLRSGARGGNVRILALAGAQRGREAAATTAALARIAACGGQSVLLIDADPSSGELARALGAPPGAIGHVMRGTYDWRDAVTHDAASPLDLLLGDNTAWPTSDAARVGLQNLLAEVRDEYDLVVLGAPPADDARAGLLARTADATVLVINAARARPLATQSAAARLAGQSRAQLGAIVLGAA